MTGPDLSNPRRELQEFLLYIYIYFHTVPSPLKLLNCVITQRLLHGLVFPTAHYKPQSHNMSLDAWKDFLKKCQFSRTDDRVSPEDEGRLVQLMYNALTSENRYPIIKGLSAGERRWIHERAAAIRVVSDSIGDGDVKDVGFDKVPPWKFEHSLSVGPPRDLNKKIRKRRGKADSRKKMEQWSTECRECGQKLTAETAMYHHSGMGPLCEECIDDDPELEEVKWECKASFWH